MKYVLDASVAAKWFNVEEFSDEAVDIMHAHVRGQIELVAPCHIVYEVGNSLWKNPQIDSDSAREAIAALVSLHIELLRPTAARVFRTMEIAKERGLTFYDASYVQATEELDVALLSADGRQIRGARGLIRTVPLWEYGRQSGLPGSSNTDKDRAE